MPSDPIVVEVLGINPVPWKASQASARGRRVQFYKPGDLKVFQESLHEALSEANVDTWVGPFSLTIYLWRQLDVGMLTKTGKLSRAHQADATNMQKAVEDACQGVLFANDRDAVEVHTYIVAQDFDCTPRIIIKIDEPSDLTVHDLPDSTATLSRLTSTEPDASQPHDPDFEF